MSDEPTIIFRVIQCVIVEEKTVITFIWNLWPCTVLQWIDSSNIMVFPGLCFSLASNHSHGTHSDLSLNYRFTSSHTHHPETLICSLTWWKFLMLQLRQVSLSYRKTSPFCCQVTVKCRRSRPAPSPAQGGSRRPKWHYTGVRQPVQLFAALEFQSIWLFPTSLLA